MIIDYHDEWGRLRRVCAAVPVCDCRGPGSSSIEFGGFIGVDGDVFMSLKFESGIEEDLAEDGPSFLSNRVNRRVLMVLREVRIRTSDGAGIWLDYRLCI